jgi:hypothetical protein
MHSNPLVVVAVVAVEDFGSCYKHTPLGRTAGGRILRSSHIVVDPKAH